MDMELLIQMVQDYPVLYDNTHPEFLKQKLKDDLWAKIAAELNYSNGKTAKEQWMKLRHNHREALRRQRVGITSQGNKPWIYQKEMEFLLPYMSKEARQWAAMADDCVDVESEADENSEDNAGVSGENDTGDDDAPTTSMDVVDGLAPKHDVVLSRKKRKWEPVESPPSPDMTNNDTKNKVLEELLEELIEIKGQQAEQFNDPLHQFFMSMYQTCKTMPSKYQIKIRKKLFYAVSDAEEELLSKDDVSNPQLSSSTVNDDSTPTASARNSSRQSERRRPSAQKKDARLER